MLSLLILLIIIGVVLAVVPIDPQVRRLVLIGVAVLFVIWLCSLLFGGLDLSWYPRRRVIVD